MRAAPLTWRRLAEPASTVAVAVAVVAALAEVTGALVAGQVAGAPSATLVGLLAALLVGAAVLDTGASITISGVIGRAEGRLRADLLDAALRQPLAELENQAVGEVLDRVDDDVNQLGLLGRRSGWMLARAVVRTVFAWLLAGFTWWPAWIAFPLTAVLVFALVRQHTGEMIRRRVTEEAAWSDHAAQFEEAVAARDDVRSALGQSHVVRRYVAHAQQVLAATGATARTATAIMKRTGLVMHALLAALAVVGVALVSGGSLGLPALVTLWLLVTAFVGQLNQITNRLPELQAGLGALQRVGMLLRAPQEPDGGGPAPTDAASVEFRGLTVGYPEGFALREIDLTVAAGGSCALVGRTGSGKSTLAKVLSRALEPPPGTVFLGGHDITELDLDALRRTVGVVTQRTELIAATLMENITLFAADVDRTAVEEALGALGLTTWVASLPAGLDTLLGPGGSSLSAGEEQLVAFARLLVREVSVVVLDEATARMDPQTERLVTDAADKLLAGRTGIVIAHRLSTTDRCDDVAVLDHGRIVQHGARTELATAPGPFQDLLTAAGTQHHVESAGALLGRRERRTPRPVPPAPATRLARTVVTAMVAHSRWGVVGGLAFFATSLLSAYGAITGWLWGGLVGALSRGEPAWWWAVGVSAGLLTAPLALAVAFRIYPLWWAAVMLRVRLAVLRGQTMQHRLARTPPGEVVARALDSDRLVRYVDRWVDVLNGLLVVAVTAIAGQSLLAGGVIGAMLLISALFSALGAPLAGSSARAAAEARARFGGVLVSALEAARTVKLAAATTAVQGQLGRIDAPRVAAVVREQRIRMVLDGVPVLLVQVGIVTAWALHLTGGWDLATTLLVTTAISGSAWFGTVCGAAVNEAPVAYRWLQAVCGLAGRSDVIALPPGVDIVSGAAPSPEPTGRVPLHRLTLEGVTAVHDDGTVGVSGVDLQIDAGSLVLLTGRVGAGKSSLLSSLAGLVDHEGRILWNDVEIDDPQLFLRPGQVAHVGQVPRVLSGTFADNITLDHNRGLVDAVGDAQLQSDVDDAGGHTALVGHRGVRLSGGQVQRLALARALATGAELVVADDVSSALDARTEVELWAALHQRGVTVVGCSAKRAALSRADRVVVLEEGRVAATGPWSELADRWGHLAG